VLVPDPASIDCAFYRLEEDVARAGNNHDVSYLHGHRARYRRALMTISELLPPGSTVLDIGSQYLHQAFLLRELGYKVIALDVPVFVELPFVAERARRSGVDNSPIANLENFVHQLPAAHVDAVLFAEILEHITFNPIPFWRSVHTLLSEDGFIYITTPNALAVMNMLSALKRLVTLQGMGLSVSAIMGNVTYGHHWKEYSQKEIAEYFGALSPDFQADVHTYHYRRYEYGRGLGEQARRLVRWLGAVSRAFDEELEVVVRVPRRTAWTVSPPPFG